MVSCAAGRAMERAERAERAALGWPVVRITSAAAVVGTEALRMAASGPLHVVLRSGRCASLGQTPRFARADETFSLKNACEINVSRT